MFSTLPPNKLLYIPLPHFDTPITAIAAANAAAAAAGGA
jgi:hypothetical protein